MLDPLWTHLSGRVDGSMIAFNELAQTNAQISERDQVPWTAGRNKRTPWLIAWEADMHTTKPSTQGLNSCEELKIKNP